MTLQKEEGDTDSEEEWQRRRKRGRRERRIGRRRRITVVKGRTEVGVWGVVVPVKHLLMAPSILVRTGWTVGGGTTA